MTAEFRDKKGVDRDNSEDICVWGERTTKRQEKFKREGDLKIS